MNITYFPNSVIMRIEKQALKECETFHRAL